VVKAPAADGRQWATESTDGDHPVLAGLVALTAVAVVVGLALGLAALTVTKVAGVGGDGAGGGATGGASMYLPDPESTSGPDGPEITLEPGGSKRPSGTVESTSAPEEQPITLVAAPARVGSFERIDLTGDYPNGNGAILQVQRREGGRWVRFGVTTAVNGESFATYVQTSRGGRNVFRVIDSDTGRKSNTVTVDVR
jgi:hypothetical protein